MPVPFRSTTTVVATAILTLALAGRGRADVLVLTDGRMLVGETVEETRRGIRFRCRVNGIWTTLAVPRRQINSLDREEGDQSDGAGSETGKGSAAAAPPPATGRPDVDPTPSLAPRPSRPAAVVIPLHGQVGGLVDGGVADTFDSLMLEECFQEALELGAGVAILDIRSPGGLLEEMEAICETIIDWDDRLRIVAYPSEAYSAAAIISLSCRELVVRPDTRLGAAVIVTGGPAGMTAVEAKMASPHHAKQRQYMAASGQPYEVVQAMTIQETELWWSAGMGFSTSAPPADGRDRWKQIDLATTILTLTGEEARTYRLARTMADTVDQLLEALEVAGEVVRFDDEVRRYTESLDHRLDQVRRHFENYFQGLAGIANGMRSFPAAVRADDRRAAARIRSQINRERSRVLNAGTQLEKCERGLLRRRVTLPDAVLERIDEDKKLLGRIRRLLDAGTVDGFNEAVDRINEVIGAWREIMG